MPSAGPRPACGWLRVRVPEPRSRSNVDPSRLGIEAGLEVVAEPHEAGLEDRAEIPLRAIRHLGPGPHDVGESLEGTHRGDTRRDLEGRYPRPSFGPGLAADAVRGGGAWTQAPIGSEAEVGRGAAPEHDEGQEDGEEGGGEHEFELHVVERWSGAGPLGPQCKTRRTDPPGMVGEPDGHGIPAPGIATLGRRG